MRRDYALSAENKMDARAALAKLGEARSSLTLLSCVNLALEMQGRGAAAVATKAGDASDRFLHSVLSRGKRPGTFRFYEEKLALFGAWAGDLNLGDVTRGSLRTWLQSIAGSRGYKLGIFRAVRALYRWALRQDPPLTPVDPTRDLDLTDLAHAPKRKLSKQKFFTIEECEALLRNIDPKFLPAVVLQLFAGIRPEEIAPVDEGKARLRWSDIRFAERQIRVEADIAKTGRPRLLEDLPDAVWAWLAPHQKKEGQVCDVALRYLQSKERSAAGFSKRKPWPADGPRHTFITYAVNSTRNVDLVSWWAGHEGKTNLIHSTYLGLTDKATAERFLALRPTIAG